MGSPRTVPVTEQVMTFGPFQLHPIQNLLLKDNQPVRLGSRAFDVLLALVERPGEVVSKVELIARVWPDTVVEEGNLRFQIASLRKVLRDGQGSARYIKNIAGRGYHFVAPISYYERPREVASTLSATPLSNLPSMLTRAIGREQIIGEIVDQLRLRRFVSLVGAGGIGKTTVALAVAERLARSYQHGVCFVDLASLGDSRFVPSVLGSALGLSIVTDNPTPSLISFVRDREMLIVLDNCEHVVEASALLAEALLQNAPGVRILATSRESLRAEGEVTRRLGPMGVPPASPAPTAATALTFPSIQLFVQRATANDGSFALSDDDAPIVADICRHLDGIPLAIELGAARIDALGIRGLAARINDRFSLLMKGRRTALPRHQTLRAMLDWSFDRLGVAEQRLLTNLAVFKAPFSLDWAAAIAEPSHDPDFDVTDALESLVSKSLVTSDVSGPAMRYRLLELTRLYGLEKLKEQGVAPQMRRQHADHMLAVLKKAELDRADAASSAWFDRYPSAIDEVRTALDWAFSADGDASLGCALTAAAAPVWIHYTLMEECCERIERALGQIGAAVGEDPRRDLQLNASLAAAALHARGVGPAMGEAWQRAAALAEFLDDVDYKLRCLWGLWLSRFMSGDFRGALSAARRFHAIPEQRVPLADLLVSERLLGMTHHILGDQETARQHIASMLDRYEAPADQSHRVRYQFDQRVAALAILGQILWVQGSPDQAMRIVELAVDEAKSTGQATSLNYALVHGACPVALQCGELTRADQFIKIQHSVAATNHYWKHWGQTNRGVRLIESGDPFEGTRLLREGLSGMPTAGFLQRYVSYLGTLAVGALEAGDPVGAGRAIEEALQQSDRTEDRWCVAELLRIKGEVILSGGRDADAEVEALFQESLDWSRRQGALSWELRTAMSLARLKRAQGRATEASTLLGAVYNRFREGFETADLIRARDLLRILEPSARASLSAPVEFLASRSTASHSLSIGAQNRLRLKVGAGGNHPES
jgi:predicted ATPase/DNA-binding winged helix-turn-helix (wHTH) protein